MIVLIGLPESAAYLASRGKTRRAADLLRRHAGVEMGEHEFAAPSAAAQATQDSPRDTILARRYLRLNIGGWMLFFSAQFIAYAFLNWAPTFLTMAHFPLQQALQASFAFNLLAVTAAIITGFLVHRFGSRRVGLIAGVLTGISVIILALRLHGADTPPSEATYWIVMLAIAGVGIFASTVIAMGYSLLTLSYAEPIRSTGIGVGLMVGRTGGVVIGLVGGVLLSLAGDQTWPFFIVLLGLTVAILAGVLIANRHIAPAA